MRSPIDNVMLVEKWNCRVECFSNTWWGEVLPYLEPLHSTSEFVFTFVKRNLLEIHDKTCGKYKFSRLLDHCSDHGNSSFYNMRPNNYSYLKWNFCDLCTSYMIICFKLFN
jgi:hypothetical protein